MDDLFKYIKSNPYPIKDKLGYGVITKHRKKYNKINKRKVLRYYRKHGFDITESYNSVRTIMSWLSDNVGGFFRECGDYDVWQNVDLYGTLLIDSHNYKDCYKAELLRIKEFQNQLDIFLKTSDHSTLCNFIRFVVPRLSYFAKHLNNNLSDTKRLIFKICHELMYEKYSENFTKQFFYFFY